MKLLHKLIIATYFMIWSCVFYYLLAWCVDFQILAGNIYNDIQKICSFSKGIYDWLTLFILFVMIHLFLFVIIFSVKLVVEQKSKF